MKKNKIILKVLIVLISILIIAIIYILSIPNNKKGNINKDTSSDKKAEKVMVITDTNIILDTPKNNEEITSPINLKGKARVFENTFNYVVADSSGNTLGEGIGMTNSASMNSYGTFSINANFKESSTKTGTIELFELSTKDGSIMNLIKVNVNFKQGNNSL
ncbi:MAG: Gmad2 immunoglobulin-like domain-containing protein [Candidatus Gracilibacteria bacterium]|nr:Gmad2 immunoglobulin-like domain-containing protein [Candidatus Gracilibacteria bacterium]MDD2909190.1 Gmad2 immunoglobulin-like domain-containing protein [Candidatus Gracilibacteria bacterium]